MAEELEQPAAIDSEFAQHRDEPDFETLYGRYHQFVRRALRKHYISASDEKLEGELDTHLSGSLVDDQGKTLSRWAVAVVRPGEPPRTAVDFIRYWPTDARSRFLVKDVPTVPVALIAMPGPPDAERARTTPVLRVVRASRGETTELGRLIARAPIPPKK